MTVFWLSAAATKYRRPDLPALNAGRGLFLLGLAVVFGAFGVVAFDLITRPTATMSSFGDRDYPGIQWTATFIAALCLAAVPVTGAVRCRLRVARGAAARNWTDRVSGVWTAVIASALICFVMAAVGATLWPGLLLQRDDPPDTLGLYLRVWAYSAGACLLATLTLTAVCRLTDGLRKSANMVVGLFVVIAWGVPLLIDFIRAEYVREHGGAYSYSWLMGCSPAGILMAVWARMDLTLWSGFLAQLVLLLVIAFAAHRMHRQPPPGPNRINA
jgi:hypothetical protein